MPKLVWYRSLYWRIALGFVALVATLLAAQGTVFLWLTGRMSEFLPGRSPQEYSQTIAMDVTNTLLDKPDIDLDEYLNGRYTGTYRSFVVVTRDNRTIVSRRIPPPPMMAQAANGRLYRELSAASANGSVPPTREPAPAGAGSPNQPPNSGSSAGGPPNGQPPPGGFQNREGDGRPRGGRGGGSDGWSGRGYGRGRGPGGPGGGPGQLVFA